MNQAKLALLPSPQQRGSRQAVLVKYLFIVALCFLLSAIGLFSLKQLKGIYESHTLPQEFCPQAPSLFPQKHSKLASELGDLYDSNDFLLRAAGLLGGAVRIPTESYDDMGDVGVDSRWNVFEEFHEYLETAFPLIHLNLAKTRVNTFGLVLEWPGSNPSLKPVLLTAHQDVVPVDPRTISSWVHPPFSGYFDGTWLWGRGSIDNKSGLIGILTAIETLLEKGFRPTRSVALSFGFDEEISGTQGAKYLNLFLLNKYGSNSFAILVDEGGGYANYEGQTFAFPAVGEKGYFNLMIEVSSPGGHSSIAPVHTGIGILSSFLVELESNPHPPRLSRSTPIFQEIQCLGVYAPNIPEDIRQAIKRSIYSDRALREVETFFVQEIHMRSMIQTTQAITLIQGGVKSNVLPELSHAVVNHRVATDSSLHAVRDRVTKYLSPLAEKLAVSLTAFGNQIVNGSASSIHVNLTDAWNYSLEPAPVSPTTSDAFKIFSGTIMNTYETSQSFKETQNSIIVSPSVMNGNTDTRWYWNLTQNIFRYSHQDTNYTHGGPHMVNEGTSKQFEAGKTANTYLV